MSSDGVTDCQRDRLTGRPRPGRRLHPGVPAIISIGLAVSAVVCAALWTSRVRAPDAATEARERAATPVGMIYVPGGECWIGTDDPDADDDARPRRRVIVGSFYIDRTEVTNAEFKRFRPAHVIPPGEEAHPVTNVTYPEAEAYARWAGKRIPTEDEWEKAARGTDGRRYPWGDDWGTARVAARVRPRQVRVKLPDAEKRSGECQLMSSRLRAVGSIPAGASPYGCLDMAGNAWEWVQGFYRGNPEQRIIRGGAVGYRERDLRTYARAIEGAGAT